MVHDMCQYACKYGVASRGGERPASSLKRQQGRAPELGEEPDNTQSSFTARTRAVCDHLKVRYSSKNLHISGVSHWKSEFAHRVLQNMSCFAQSVTWCCQDNLQP